MLSGSACAVGWQLPPTTGTSCSGCADGQSALWLISVNHSPLENVDAPPEYSNTAALVARFGEHGLTGRDYEAAAAKHPEWRTLNRPPEIVIGNIEGVVRHFASNGLTIREYLKAACKQPTLFCQRPETLISNIEGVVEHFGAEGLTIRAYLKAATKQPQLFYQRPDTLTGNIEGVVQHFGG